MLAAPVPAALGLLAAAGVLAGCAGPVRGTVEATDDAPRSPVASATATAGAALVLDVPAAAPGRCRPPDVALLRRQDVALRGEVTAVDGRAVTLAVDHWFRGGPGEVVEVDAAPDALRDLLLAPDLEVGTSHLLAARDGEVVVCGASGPAAPALVRLYERAYGAP